MHIKIVPLFLQLPAMIGDDDTGFICSAFGTSKVHLFPYIDNYDRVHNKLLRKGRSFPLNQILYDPFDNFSLFLSCSRVRPSVNL